MAIEPTAAKGFPIVGVLDVEGARTGDMRMLAKDSGRWPQLPLPMRRARVSGDGHDGAVTVGSIDSIVRMPSGELAFRGKLFDTPDGRECYAEMFSRYAESGLKYGVSIDPDDIVASEDEMGLLTFEEYRLRGATMVDIPAYNTAYAILEEQVPMAMVAAGAPRLDTPASWFADPRLSGPTPLTVTSEGRIFGHAATWNTCHTAFAGQCITAPRSRTNYAYFRTGLAPTAEGVDVPIGHVTMGIGHANAKLNAEMAAEHYDNVASIVADVSAGEDAHGLWIAGTVREGVTDEQVRELRAAAVSGDWRQIEGNLELVAMLSVVSPGFPVPRMRALVASGEVQSLTASAVFESEASVADETPAEVAPVDVPEIAPEAVVQTLAEEASMAEESVADQPDAPDAENVTPEEVEEDYDVKAEIASLKDSLAAALEFIESMKAASAEAAPAEDAAPVEEAEALPAVEHSAEDILAALDMLVNGPAAVDVASLLAGLDAKVGA